MAAELAECGAGKTLIALATLWVHSGGREFTALYMCPPHLVNKVAREAFLTLPRVRVFFIDGIRDANGSDAPSGVNEVKLRRGQIVREGLRTTLSELRQAVNGQSARERWRRICPGPALFVVSRERAKLSYRWRHSYQVARSGRFQGSVVNPDSGTPVYLGGDGERLLAADFKKVKLSEVLGAGSGEGEGKRRRSRYSALWQADGRRLRRFAPASFIGRYMKDFFDYFVADEVHELKGEDTAQGNALGTLAASAGHTLVLTGTLLGGYADELFPILFRLNAARMIARGFEHDEGGMRAFGETYGLLEQITVIEPADNAYSEGKVTKRVRRRPGASPLLFGHYLMDLAAFLSLEDISSALPAYREEVVPIAMDEPLKEAYDELEQKIKEALREHRGNQSVVSTALNALLAYPDRPYAWGELTGYEYNPETGRRERFEIACPRDLDPSIVYAKERCLVEEVKKSVASGRKAQVYAVYTQKRDVTARLAEILSKEGLRVAVLKAEVKPEAREAWYEKKLREGVEVFIAHPRLVALGLDLMFAADIVFYQTGYSIFTLRQASRRSWRIGQRRNVVVKFLHYAETMQETCLRLMGKKLLVSLAMEGKFAAEGLQAMEQGDDLLMAMARELVTEQHIGETADQVWAALQKQQAEAFGIRSEERPSVGTEPVAMVDTPPSPLAPPAAPTVVEQLLNFGASLEELRKRKASRRRAAVAATSNQLALF
ncbi:MAG TPA: helicase-related protein [Terracidiphilus sp.]|nr:helicase-related protein [Terracidiphilus sp.]